jgi:hypothetical protein
LAKKNRWAKLREDKKRDGSEHGPGEKLAHGVFSF